MTKERLRFLSAVLAVCMLLSCFGAVVPKADAAATLVIDANAMYLPKDASSPGSADGTPTAFHYVLTGGTAGQTCELGAWLYDGAASKGFFYDVAQEPG